MEKILVVEDDPSTASVVRHHLEFAGYEAVATDNVEDAWRLFMRESLGAAIVDLKLGGVAGWRLLERVRGDPRLNRLPVIVLTGMLEPGVVERVKSLGCVYLSKPFVAAALIEKLGRLIEGSSGLALGADEEVRIDLVPTDVLILIRGYRIEGKVFLPPEAGRFSDAWESLLSDRRDFVPVVDARLTTEAGERLVAPPYLQLRKSEVLAIMPAGPPGG